jgi:hypothetical protein
LTQKTVTADSTAKIRDVAGPPLGGLMRQRSGH